MKPSEWLAQEIEKVRAESEKFPVQRAFSPFELAIAMLEVLKQQAEKEGE